MAEGDSWEAAVEEQERSEMTTKMRSLSTQDSSASRGGAFGNQNSPGFFKIGGQKDTSSSVFGGSQAPSDEPSQGFGTWMNPTSDKDKSWRYQHDDRTEGPTSGGSRNAARGGFAGGFQNDNSNSFGGFQSKDGLAPDNFGGARGGGFAGTQQPVSVVKTEPPSTGFGGGGRSFGNGPTSASRGGFAGGFQNDSSSSGGFQTQQQPGSFFGGGFGGARGGSQSSGGQIQTNAAVKTEPLSTGFGGGQQRMGGIGRGRASHQQPLKQEQTPNWKPPGAFGDVKTEPASEGDSWEQDLDEDDKDKGVVKAEASILNKFLHDKLVQIQGDSISVRNEPPSSPLFSVRTFEELHLKDELLKGIYEMGFSKPSKIQEKCLPVLVAQPPHNMIAQSQSGTGKTAAFVLTMLTRVDTNLNYPQCLCLAPTYELARQIGDVVERMGKFLPNLGVKFAIRGNRLFRGQEVREHIIIGTPGTCLDWVIKFRVFDPKKLRVFVLDEADVMISQQGHQDQSIRIQQTLSPECQLLLFSATYDEEVMEFAEKVVPDALVITVRLEEQTLENIRQYYVDCFNRHEKFKAICNIYGTLTIGQSIIFCHTRKAAAWLVEEMTHQGHAVALLSGELDITQRASVIQRFKDAKEKVLITTNVCARGIDVQQVTIVINFDVPFTVDRRPDFETYLHRIGRTGRFGKPGIAVNFVDSEFSRQILKDIENHFNKTILKLEADDVEALEKLDQ